MLLCDRCKKPIVGESKKLLDVCPDCYYQVMSYISTGSTNVGITKARLIGSLTRRVSPKVLSIVLVLIVLIAVSSGVAISTYSQYQAPFQAERQLVNSLSGNLAQDQNTIQAAATLLLKYKSENANLTSQASLLNQTISNDTDTIASLQGTISSLKSQSSTLENTVAVLQRNITDLENRSNTFVIWNAPVNVSAGYYLLETVPDAFDFHDNFSSSVPVDVFYFTSTQFVQWSTNRTISGTYPNFTSTEKQSDTFKLGEGCGGYLVVYSFEKAGTIFPNVSATYDPAAKPTGSCSNTA
jgi:hypothetical protein